MWNIFLDAAAPRHRRPISRPMPGMPGRCAGPSCWRVGGVTLAPWHPAGAARGGRATSTTGLRLPLVTAFRNGVVHLYVVVRTPFDFHRVSCPGV
jgi:hypothetical protein